MSFDYSTLITNRARSDSDTLKTLLSKPMAEWTAEERTAFNRAVMRGSYDYTDINRVDACLEDLVARLGQVGCNVPGYERLKIERGKKPASRLPEGYTEVQYIQSSGVQYINSGFNPKSTSRIVMDFEFLKNGVASPFMSRDIQRDSNMFGIFNINGRLRSDYGNEKKSFSTSLSPLKRMIYDRDQNVCTIGPETISNTAASFSAPIPVFLFASDDNGKADYFTHGKCYSCQFYDNGNLIRDYIPCVDPTGTAGLYDLVGGKFYGNRGTGVFLAGPPKATLPEGYTQVEYIQSSGAQYVDTGFKPNQASRVDMVAQMPELTTYPAFFGTRAGSKKLFWLYANSATAMIYGYGTSKLQADCAMTELLFIKSDANKVYANRQNLITATATTFSADFPLYLFAVNNSGASQYPAKMKLFQCAVYDKSEKIRDFIPCKNAGGAVGLYDLVEQKFYGNAGTGNFTAGETVTWPEEPVTPDEPAETLDPYTWYESDVPVPSQMARYRANVAAVRAALRMPEGTPETPEIMRRLTVAEANSIEAILLALNFILSKIPAAVRHCGVTVCGSKGVRA